MLDENSGFSDLLNSDEERAKLAFDNNYQYRFIKLFLENVEFYEQFYDIVVPSYFNGYQKQVIDKITNFSVTYNRRPDYADLETFIKTTEKSQKSIEHLVGCVQKIQEITVNSPDLIKDTAYEFFKKRALAEAFMESVGKWDKGDFDGIISPINNALNAGEIKEDGLFYLNSVEETLLDVHRNPIGTMDEIDELTGGGLASGEMGVIMAPTGGGKSMALVILAAHALLKGKKVVYYSLELDKNYVAKRFHACLNDLHQAYLKHFPQVIQERAEEIEQLGGELLIEKFGTRMATIQKLKNHLQGVERSHGFKPDIIFIDYADILKPEEVMQEHRHTLQVLYQSIRGFGEEVGCPIWTATQTNREGSKNENVGIDTISDAYGKAAEVDFLCSIGKNDEAKSIKFDRNHVADVTEPNSRFGILKNRFGPDGFFLDAILDTSRVYLELFDEKEEQNNESKEDQIIEKAKNMNPVTNDVQGDILERESGNSINALLSQSEE